MLLWASISWLSALAGTPCAYFMAFALARRTPYGFSSTERAYALALPSLSLVSGALAAYHWWTSSSSFSSSWWLALLAPPMLVSSLIIFIYQAKIPHRRA